MSATLVGLPVQGQETAFPCADCPALERLEWELGEVRREVSELRCEVGYWKRRHADAVKRNEQLTEELRQAQGQIRSLQDKLFGRKSEKRGRADRGNELFDPLESSTVCRSGSLWSGRLAATMFSLLATLTRWKLNPRRWLTWYLESCAAAGGRAPEEIQPFLPWNLSDEHRLTLGARVTAPSAHDTS